MRPATVPHQWRRIAKQPARRRLVSKPAHSNLLSRLLHPRRFSKWISALAQRFVMGMTLDHQISTLAPRPTPVAKITEDLWGLVQMKEDHPELLLPSSLSEINTPRNFQHPEDTTGLVDKAVTWMLAPVFFCCVVAEEAKPPQWRSWATTEVFSRVVVSFMLRLFVLATEVSGGRRQKHTQLLEEGK